MSAESKSDNSDRLRPSTSDVSPSSTTVMPMAHPVTATQGTQSVAPTSSTSTGQQDDQHKSNRTSYSVNKQQTAALYQHYLNTFNSSLSREELKSHRTRGSISSSLSQHPQQQAILVNRELHNNQVNQKTISNHPHHLNQRILNHNMAHIYHIPPTNQNHNHYASPNVSNTSNLSRSTPKDEFVIPPKSQQQQPHLNQRTYSTSAIPSNHQQSYPKQRHPKDSLTKMSTINFRPDQLDRDSEETTTIKEELENDLEGYKNSELEAISSLERNLPIELSFLIRQQAHCLAKTNYLERQLRELKDSVNQQQQVDMNRISSASISNRNHPSRPITSSTTAAMTHTKNGNFILSDDSGGEYSRATISDDDELSSLLDQIVKTVRPDQRFINDNTPINSDSQIHLQQQQQHQHQYQQQQRLSTTYNTMISNQHQPLQQNQPYTVINPNQLHHQQAVPIFVMSSPIAVAHPSSISSNILPGVHFHPEPRYNQYYEDFYAINNTPPSTVAAPTGSMVQRQNANSGAYRSQHFDNSISAIEQLVNQKEKRQIIAQMKSADNWLKMRATNGSSSLFNHQESSLKNVGDKQTAVTCDETQEQGDVASVR